MVTAPLRAVDLARALGQEHPPTPEQAAIIEAPLAPLLVVAGAGSGKTETMSARVLWLVATGQVAPDEVLGLTFTRKAAAELGERLATRLATLRAAGLWRPQGVGAAPLGALPTVSTYHSYAGRLVREHGARLGVEADTRLLTEAAAWQFAHEVVLGYDGPMDEVTKAESTVTAAVVALAGELAEHLVDVPDVDAHLTEVITALDSLVKPVGSRRRGLPPEIRDAVVQLRERRQILPLLTAYAARKRERSAMDFADQMAVAATLAMRFPQVGAHERRRFKVVLLDEFQDTSEAQLQLLRALFAEGEGPAPVTAVGDPHQSIYGWRGASSTTLRQFRSAFGGEGLAPVLPLTTSWRNAERVLGAANAVAEPLRAASVVPVESLVSRPGAARGRVDVARLETLEDEAVFVVDWVLERRARPGRRTAAILCRKRSQFDPVVAALEAKGVPHEVVGLGGLLHTPEVADLVALLWVVQDPSRGDHLLRLLTGTRCRLGVADLDALGAWAREVARRSRHTEGQRSTGSAPGRSGGGAEAGSGGAGADLVAGGAGREAGSGGAGAGAVGVGLGDLEESVAVSLVEAIEELPPTRWRGPEGEVLGPLARERVAGLAEVIAALRTRTGAGLAEVVALAETALGLDIEVLARPGWSVGAARAHLDAFEEVAAGFEAASDRPTLGGFLSWLDAALDEERGLDLGWIETSPQAVQVMTVHAAKGLEWDVVAVPGLVEGTFPVHSGVRSSPHGARWGHSTPTDKAWLGGLAGLPHDLRGDRDGLPRFGWERLADWDDAGEAWTDYLAAAGAHALGEERRLAYVAMTRARTDLLLTAHLWGTAKTPRITSRFLREVRDQGWADRQVPWAAMPATDPIPDNPRLALEVAVPWPPPQAAAHAEVWQAAADLVRAERATDPQGHLPGASVGDPEAHPPREWARKTDARRLGEAATDTRAHPSGEWAAEIALLLAERDRGRAGADTVAPPAHLSTSNLVALATDAPAFAAALRRPMPAPPADAARLGTAFHAWIEGHYAHAALLDPDDLPGAADGFDTPPGMVPGEDGAAPHTRDLADLREHFLASPWAARSPLELEVPVETTIGGVPIRGRIDAVFADPDDPAGFVVVDWKSGPPPPATEAAYRAVQLASYRLAWARLRGIDPRRVRGAFFYAATGATVWPGLADERDLTDLLRRTFTGADREPDRSAGADQ